MKKLTILLFSILISFSSYGEWTLISEGDMGECCSKHYIDKDTIIENKGYVYWWSLGDSSIPLAGTLSAKFYNESDCGEKRTRELSSYFYKKPMGKDKHSSTDKHLAWKYPEPKSHGYHLLNYACNYVK